MERRAARGSDRARSRRARNEQATLTVGAAASLRSNGSDHAMLRVGTAAGAENSMSRENVCMHETREMPEFLVGLHLYDVNTLPGFTRGSTVGAFGLGERAHCL